MGNGIYQPLADELGAAPIQHIGKLLVRWRPQPEKEKVIDEDRMAGPRDFKVLKQNKLGGRRPEATRLPVPGTRPPTAGAEARGSAEPVPEEVGWGALGRSKHGSGTTILRGAYSGVRLSTALAEMMRSTPGSLNPKMLARKFSSDGRIL